MSPCQGCHAGCCRAFAVPITGADILRIQRKHQLSFWDFVVRWEDRAGLISHGFIPQFHFADEPETPFVICLKHVPSATFPQTTKCVFLRESPPTAEHPLGTGECSIHGVHPLSCRVFPTRPNTDGTLAILCDVPERARPEAEGDAYRLCPTAWSVEDVDPVAGIEHLVLTRFEMEYFHQVATAWNRDPQPWRLFPEYLNLVYSSRVVADSHTDDGPVTLPFEQPKTAWKQRIA